jgi:hypothetical protein
MEIFLDRILHESYSHKIRIILTFVNIVCENEISQSINRFSTPDPLRISIPHNFIFTYNTNKNLLLLLLFNTQILLKILGDQHRNFICEIIFKFRFIHFLWSYHHQMWHIDSSLSICFPREILGVVINKTKNNLSIKIYRQITKFSNKVTIFG